MSGSCAGCAHASPNTYDDDAPHSLLCLRYPPQVVLADDTVLQVRPSVAPDDTCGEHQPRTARRPPPR